MNSTFGRCTIREFWIRFILLEIVFIIIRLNIEKSMLSIFFISFSSLLLQLYILYLGILRMHDINKSGWYMVIPFYNLYLASLPGDEETNMFGPNPRINKDIFKYEKIFLISLFLGCAIYAILSEIKIFQINEQIKVIIFFITFLVSFILFVTKK